MFKKKLILGVVSAAVFTTGAMAAEKPVVEAVITKENTKCVPLKEFTVEKATNVLKAFLKGGVKIIDVGPSPIKSLYEVDVDVNGRRFPVFVDCTLSYLVMGNVINISSKENYTRKRGEDLTQQAIEERKREIAKYIGKDKVEKLKNVLGPRFNDIKIADLKGLPENKDATIVLGNPKGKITMYIIDDPECPFCAKLDEELNKLLKKRKDLKVEVILFPLQFHKHASGIAANITCQNDMKKKAELLEESFKAVRSRDQQKLSELELKKECKGKDVNEALRQNFMFARATGVTGTPTIIFPKGLTVSGYMQAEQIEKILDILTEEEMPNILKGKDK